MHTLLDYFRPTRPQPRDWLNNPRCANKRDWNRFYDNQGDFDLLIVTAKTIRIDKSVFLYYPQSEWSWEWGMKIGNRFLSAAAAVAGNGKVLADILLNVNGIDVSVACAGQNYYWQSTQKS